MNWFRIEGRKVHFPRWPRLDAWLDDPRNEWFLIVVLAVVCLGVWLWGASL